MTYPRHRQTRRFLPALCLLGVIAALSLAAGRAWAWGEEAHRIIGLIADQELSATTRSNLRALTGEDSLAALATWLDDNRDRLKSEIPGSQRWHYDDVPVTCGPMQPPDPAVYCADGNCASHQLDRHLAILRDPQASPAERRFAILVLAHVVGDIHQPLHTADHQHDAGGNRLMVRFRGAQASRMHWVWDVGLVETIHAGQSAAAVAADLRVRFIAMAEQERWTAGGFLDWIAESHRIARSDIYAARILPGFVCGRADPGAVYDLPESYAEDMRPVIDRQLARAGIRLGRLIEQSLR